MLHANVLHMALLEHLLSVRKEMDNVRVRLAFQVAHAPNAKMDIMGTQLISQLNVGNVIVIHTELSI